MYGGYDKLGGGQGEEALEDLTGGISEYVQIAGSVDLFDRISKTINQSSLITGTIGVILFLHIFVRIRLACIFKTDETYFPGFKILFKSQRYLHVHSIRL